MISGQSYEKKGLFPKTRNTPTAIFVNKINISAYVYGLKDELL